MSDETEFDLNILVQRAQTMHRRLERAREDLSRIEAEGHGGGGLVRAVVSGENMLVALSIDGSLIDPDDPETLVEFVREAVNDATRAVVLTRTERISGITEGLADAIPAAARSQPGVQPMIASRLRDMQRRPAAREHLQTQLGPVDGQR